MNQTINPNQVQEDGFSTGAVVNPIDPRNFIYGQQIGDATVPFDWNAGYDVEEDLSSVIGSPTTLFVNDQGPSFSCGGQASSKKGEAISAFYNKKYIRKSAKFPYAQVFVPGGGSDAQALFGIETKQGFCDEEILTSYDLQQPPQESFMERKEDITPACTLNANKDRAVAYAQVPLDIDSVAQAIRDTKGVILGIYGQNNGTWRTAFPIPPNSIDVWAHWLYAGKAKMINGKKYVGFLNSWGTSVGENGWQWIGEDYFAAQRGIWVAWTMIYNNAPLIQVPLALFSSVLRYGMKNGDVKKLQVILGLTTDGIFGKDTLAAVKAFQTKYGLVSDGIVGGITASKLKSVFNL